MKKNVNVGAWGRGGLLAALALASSAPWAAAACATSDGSRGLVSAPMLPGSTGEDAAAADVAPARAEAGAASARALPDEPRRPDAPMCKRAVSCYLPSTDPPPWPLPHPFEKCLETLGGAKLSVKETTAARARTPGTCCYVDFGCGGEPARHGR